MSLIGKRFRLPSNRVPPFLSLSVSFCRSISATCLWNECHRANLTLARIWGTFKWTAYRSRSAIEATAAPPCPVCKEERVKWDGRVTEVSQSI